MLAASQGTDLMSARIEGPDEREACQSLVTLIEDKFGEGQ